MTKIFFFSILYITIVDYCNAQIVHACESYQAMIVGELDGCDNNPWYLVFEDNFEGNSLDMSKWTIPYQGVIRDSNFTEGKQWYANTGTLPSIPFNNNIELSNGTLKLIAKKEDPPITGTWVTNWGTNPPATKTSSFEYSSAEIDSKYKFGYGKYEIRCKIPKGKGFWPAFWLYGGENEDEIDIFEFWNEYNCLDYYKPERLSKNPHFNIHHNHNPHQDDDKDDCSSDLFGCGGAGIDNATDFSLIPHTFTLIWDFYKIEWYIDGILKRRTYRFYSKDGAPLGCGSVGANSPLLISKAYPTQEYQNIIANLAIQSNEKSPDGSTPFPSQLEIDYIKYYKRVPCRNIVVINNIGELNLVSGAYNILFGNEITIANNVAIPVDQTLTIIAGSEINLLPGFSSGLGSGFSTKIDPNLPCSFNKKMFSDEGLISRMDSINNEDSTIKIYPNPVSESLNIEFSANTREVQNYTVVLTDLNGRILLNSNCTSVQTILNVSSLKSGIYILNIFDLQTDVLLHSSKIIIE